MMRGKALAIATAALCSAALFASPAVEQAHAAGKVYHLKIANFFPPPAKQSKILVEFGKELEQRSGGRIKVQYFAGGSLLTGPSMFRGIQNGIADIGYTHVYYTPGEMPICEGIGLPLGVPTGWVGSHMAQDFYNKFHPNEFPGVKILAIHGNAPSMVISTKPVRTLADMKGLTIRAPGVSGDIVRALGATPTPTPMMEVYDSIAKGVNQAVWGPYETLKSFRFAQVAKYVTLNWQIGAPFPFYLAMNRKSFDRLPKDLQALIDTMSGEYQERYALMWNEIDLEGKAYAKTQGVKFIELSPAQVKKWKAAVQPVVNNYINRMVKKGHSRAQVKGWIAYMKERIKYWTKKQEEYHIPSATGPAGVRPEAYVQ